MLALKSEREAACREKRQEFASKKMKIWRKGGKGEFLRMMKNEKHLQTERRQA